jgi:hypothetical protein
MSIQSTTAQVAPKTVAEDAKAIDPNVVTKAPEGVAAGDSTISEAAKSETTEATTETKENTNGFFNKSYTAIKTPIVGTLKFVANVALEAVKGLFGILKFIITWPFNFFFSSEEAKAEETQAEKLSAEAKKAYEESNAKFNEMEKDFTQVKGLKEKDDIFAVATDDDFKALGLDHYSRMHIREWRSSYAAIGKKAANENPQNLLNIIVTRLESVLKKNENELIALKEKAEKPVELAAATPAAAEPAAVTSAAALKI